MPRVLEMLSPAGFLFGSARRAERNAKRTIAELQSEQAKSMSEIRKSQDALKKEQETTRRRFEERIAKTKKARRVSGGLFGDVDAASMGRATTLGGR